MRILLLALALTACGTKSKKNADPPAFPPTTEPEVGSKTDTYEFRFAVAHPSQDVFAKKTTAISCTYSGITKLFYAAGYSTNSLDTPEAVSCQVGSRAEDNYFLDIASVAAAPTAIVKKFPSTTTSFSLAVNDPNGNANLKVRLLHAGLLDVSRCHTAVLNLPANGRHEASILDLKSAALTHFNDGYDLTYHPRGNAKASWEKLLQAYQAGLYTVHTRKFPIHVTYYCDWESPTILSEKNFLIFADQQKSAGSSTWQFKAMKDNKVVAEGKNIDPKDLIQDLNLKTALTPFDRVLLTLKNGSGKVLASSDPAEVPEAQRAACAAISDPVDLQKQDGPVLATLKVCDLSDSLVDRGTAAPVLAPRTPGKSRWFPIYCKFTKVGKSGSDLSTTDSTQGNCEEKSGVALSDVLETAADKSWPALPADIVSAKSGRVKIRDIATGNPKLVIEDMKGHGSLLRNGCVHAILEFDGSDGSAKTHQFRLNELQSHVSGQSSYLRWLHYVEKGGQTIDELKKFHERTGDKSMNLQLYCEWHESVGAEVRSID
jgi:hypothetical protein